MLHLNHGQAIHLDNSEKKDGSAGLETVYLSEQTVSPADILGLDKSAGREYIVSRSGQALRE